MIGLVATTVIELVATFKLSRVAYDPVDPRFTIDRSVRTLRWHLIHVHGGTYFSSDLEKQVSHATPIFDRWTVFADPSRDSGWILFFFKNARCVQNTLL